MGLDAISWEKAETIQVPAAAILVLTVQATANHLKGKCNQSMTEV